MVCPTRPIIYCWTKDIHWTMRRTQRKTMSWCIANICKGLTRNGKQGAHWHFSPQFLQREERENLRKFCRAAVWATNCTRKHEVNICRKRSDSHLEGKYAKQVTFFNEQQVGEDWPCMCSEQGHGRHGAICHTSWSFFIAFKLPALKRCQYQSDNKDNDREIQRLSYIFFLSFQTFLFNSRKCPTI